MARRILIAATILWTVSAFSTAPATTMTMTLDGIGVDTCGVGWREGSCALHVAPTVTGDYSPPGSCAFNLVPDGIELLGARLVVDVGTLAGIETVEVDLLEEGGKEHTRIYAYAVGADTDYDFVMSWWNGGQTEQTVTMDVSAERLGMLVISGDASLIREVRLNGATLVGLPAQSWGTLKGRY